MKYRYLTATLLLSGLTIFSSCKEDFAEINSNPSAVSTPNVRYLFAQCIKQFQPADYEAWFYGYKSMGAWSQMSVRSGGNTSKTNLDVSTTGCGYGVGKVLLYTNEIKYRIQQMSEEERAKYEYIQHLCTPMCVFLSMEDSDMYGSRQYSEAQMIRYGGTMTPKYDTQEELFDLWLKQLDESIEYLNSHPNVGILGSQDFIYNDDIKKWAKFANSLKLKIASRLINIDKNRAIQIVEEAAKNPAGFTSEAGVGGDDFIINKGRTDNNFNNTLPGMNIGNEVVIEFMKKNKDPRLFTLFMKNSYNANVIQAFFDQDRAQYIPSYIMQYVNYEEKDGKKTFTGWKAPGEPCVRYYGAPVENDAASIQTSPGVYKYAEYFDPKSEAFKLFSANGQEIFYSPLCSRNTFAIKGNFQYEFPDAPDVPPIKTDQQAWYGFYFTAGETNLLLAEFKLLGANLPKSAQEYMTEGARASMKVYNAVAGKNKLPYYEAGYINDKFDKPISYSDAQIEESLLLDAYQLNGSQIENLEKVYIQQMIHYMMLPMDMFVTCRRSGVPMKGSNILPRLEFDPVLGDQYIIPRRFAVSEPLVTDPLYDITIAAYEAQGFTYQGEMKDAPSVLTKERVWYDKNAPEFGAGPKIN